MVGLAPPPDPPRPASAAELMVPINDPQAPSAAELAALRARCRRFNMALYALDPGRLGDDPQAHRRAVGRLAQGLGLERLDPNRLAEADGLSLLAARDETAHQARKPYTRQALGWHTDGVYNPPERTIRGMILHCIQPAAEGGENRLLDPRWVCHHLGRLDPGHLSALGHPEALTIPGTATTPDRPGPVFGLADDGALLMRYTTGRRHTRWRDDPATTRARQALEALLESASGGLTVRLEKGQGLVSNNVLHTRTAFTDGPTPRQLLRARYLDPVA